MTRIDIEVRRSIASAAKYRTDEAKVKDALYLIDSAENLCPSIHTEIVRMVPSILTTALGHPVHPSLVDELVEVTAEIEKAHGEGDAIWRARAEYLTARIIHGPTS